MLRRPKSCLFSMEIAYLSVLGTVCSQRSPQISFFIFHFFWLSTRWTLKPLYLDQIKLFEKSKSTLTYYFFDAVLLLTRNQALFYRLGIKFWHFIQFSRPSEGGICSLPRSAKFPTWIFFSWVAALYIPSSGQNHAWLMCKSLSRAVECTNYKPKKAGPGHNF